MNQTSCLKISCNASNAAPAAPRLYQQSSGFILPVVELEDEDAHYRPEALVVTPWTDRPADRVPDGNGTLIAGQKLDGYREHRFALEAGPLRLRRAFCGVEREGRAFSG